MSKVDTSTTSLSSSNDNIGVFSTTVENNSTTDSLSSLYSRRDSRSPNSAKESSVFSDVENNESGLEIAAENGNFKQYSFDPGMSSSESDTAYERLEEARRLNRLEREEERLKHEKDFTSIKIPEWSGMAVKKWKPSRIHLHFYLRHLADSNVVGDYKYRVQLKTTTKLCWYVSRSTVPPEAGIRAAIHNVTNQYLLGAIKNIYIKIVKFGKNCAMMRQCDMSSDSDT